jgi:hypothetical protein
MVKARNFKDEINVGTAKNENFVFHGVIPKLIASLGAC